jgi:hypothetical protein
MQAISSSVLTGMQRIGYIANRAIEGTIRANQFDHNCHSGQEEARYPTAPTKHKTLRFFGILRERFR